MKRLILPVAFIVAANAVVLGLASRERARPAIRTGVTVCADLLAGGEKDRGRPPALLLTLATDSQGPATGLDSAGLRALGFSAAVAGRAGKLRKLDDPWPRQRPAWVRLRQGDDSLHRFKVVEVAPNRERLAPDSTSILVQGIVGLVERVPTQEAGSGGHEHGPPPGPRVMGVVNASVIQVMPRELHLDHALISDLRRTISPTPGCGPTREVNVMQGAGGGVWVER